MPAWLPPIFATPCREPQTDAHLYYNLYAGSFPEKIA